MFRFGVEGDTVETLSAGGLAVHDGVLAPEVCRLVLFPSYHRFSHAALPVEGGVRYAIATWLKRAGVPSVGHAEDHLEIVRPEELDRRR